MKQYESFVRGPVECQFDIRRLQQQFVAAGAARRLDKEIETPFRDEENAIRRPSGENTPN